MLKNTIIFADATLTGFCLLIIWFIDGTASINGYVLISAICTVNAIAVMTQKKNPRRRRARRFR